MTTIGIRLFSATGLAACLLWAASPAQATVTFCNKQADEITVAIAYTPKDAPGTSTGGDLGTTTEGWWTIAPGNCSTVNGGNAAAMWLYHHTITKQGRIGGNTMLCVKSHAPFKVGQQFKQAGASCQEGWNLRGFSRIDADKTNWTLNVK
jgi:uncharacterized membrane protein